MISSNAFTPIVIGARGVDPKQLSMPALLNEDILVALIHQVFPDLPPFVDDFPSSGLVLSDEGSQSSNSPPFSPQSYGSIPHSPQHHHHTNYSLPSSPDTSVSSQSPHLRDARVLIEAPCAGGMPLKENDGGYRCSSCNKHFKRRDDAKRHIRTAGKRVACKYCGKPASGREEGKARHLRENKNCWKEWEVGCQAGRFDVRSVQDAYYN